MQNRSPSLLCPNCRKLISRTETTCPFCGTANPGSALKNNVFTRSLRQGDQLLKLIIYTNIGMYIVSLLIYPRYIVLSVNPMIFLAPEWRSLYLLGATGAELIYHPYRLWTLISANYLHGSLLHIVFNMIAIRQLAPLIVHEFGSARMLIIYMIGGVVGFGISYVAGVPRTIGASAALCSLIGAALYFGKSRGGPYGQAIYRQVISWVVSLFVFGLVLPGINNWGHGGGIAAGIALGYLLGYKEQKPESQYHRIVSGLCVASTILTLGWALRTAIIYR